MRLRTILCLCAAATITTASATVPYDKGVLTRETRMLYGEDDDNTTVRGMITDDTGSGLIGVAVAVQGTTKGAISDINGYYIIEANPGDVLVFSYLGYKTQEITVTKKRALNITLAEDVQELEEAVVVGMGTQRKASVIGSISSVKVNELNAPQSSLTANLSGRIAGTVAIQRSGEPGQDEGEFWIRGLSTFGDNQKPLMLVDGVERSINDLSIDEIESVSVLKDASATAVYGVRAANGVVLVTTRKGTAQKPTVEFRAEYGVSDLPKLPEFLGGGDYARLSNEARRNGGGASVYTDDEIGIFENPTEWWHPYVYPNVDWYKQTFKKWSQNMNATVNIHGGSDRARYFVTGGFLRDKGNLRNLPKENEYNSNIDRKRYNFRSNVDITVTPTTIINLEVGANLTNMHQPGIGERYEYGQWLTPAEEVFHWAFLVGPTSTPVRLPLGYDLEGNMSWGWGAPGQVGEKNPVERLVNSGYRRFTNASAMSQVVLNQDLPFITEGLSFRGSFSFDYNTTSRQLYTRDPYTYNVRGYDDINDALDYQLIDSYNQALRYSHSHDNNRATETKAQFTYERVFNKIHRVGAMFMYYQRNYLNSSAGSSLLSLPYRKQGIAARATYSYDDRYFAEFNIGYNGSENFPKKKRFGTFPAGAVGYLISNEKFWNQEVVNVLKIKGSMGLVGNESLQSSRRFGYLDFYDSTSGDYIYNWGQQDYEAGKMPGTVLTQVGVPSLTWEKGIKKNLGVELKMFNSKVSLDFDYFHETRKDILIARGTIPGFAGFNKAQVNANMGRVRNHGFDATAEVNHKIANEVDVRVYGNFTLTKNKVKEMDEPEKQYRYTMQTGNRLGQNFGLIANGYFKDQDDIDNHAEQKFGTVRPGDRKYIDVNGDGVINNDDMVPIGYSNRVPEVMYGFGMQVRWKNWDLGAFFRGQDRISAPLSGPTFIPFQSGIGKSNLFTKALDRWTVENPRQDAFYPRLTDGTNSNNQQRSTAMIYNARYLRLSDLELGYTFDRKLIAPAGLSNLRIYVLGTNLAVWSKWKMWDPESLSNNGKKYPLPRKINVGVRATF